MNAKNLLALSFAAAFAVAIPAAHAEYDHGGRDYRSDHHEHAGDRRDYNRDRYAHEHYDRYDRHDRRVYYREPRGYVMAAPVFAPPPVLYSAPSNLNIVVPLQF